MLALKLFIYCYLVLSSFHAVVCVSHLLCFSFPFPCSPFGAFQFARHGDKISEKKEQNVRMEEKKQKKRMLCLSSSWLFLFGGSCSCVFFHSPISRAGENHAVFLHPPSASVVPNNTERRGNFKIECKAAVCAVHL